MELVPYIFISIVGLFSGLLSGISGGGGTLLSIPALIFAGLPPQVAVATAKMGGIGDDLGGLGAFLKSGHIRKDIIRVMIPVAIIVGLVTPFIFAVIESRGFQIALAILMLLMLPTLFFKKKTIKPPTKKHKFFGYILYSGVLFLQSLFSGGVGSLAIYVLTLLFGATKLQTMATRRAIVAVLSPITVVALFIGGFVEIWFGLAIIFTSFIGAVIGAKIVLKQGEKFVTTVMAIAVVISSIALLIKA